MENNQKPEWFELAENDQPVSRPLKKKSAPMRNLALILAGILVIPMGAGFALLTHEDHSAVAVETLNSTQDSPAATSSTQAKTSNAITMPAASRDDDEEGDDDDYRAPVFSATSSKAPTTITSPGSASADIILPPTKKAGDDDEDPPTKQAGDDDEDEDEDEDDDDEDDDD